MSAVAQKMQNCGNRTIQFVEKASIAVAIVAGITTFIVLSAITSAHLLTAIGLTTSLCQANLSMAFMICKWGAITAAGSLLAIMFVEIARKAIDCKKSEPPLSF